MNSSTAVQFSSSRNKIQSQSSTNKPELQRRVIVISRHFSKNVYLVTGKSNFQDDEDVFIIAVNRRALSNISVLPKQTNALNLKIRSSNNSNIRNTYYPKKYLPNFKEKHANDRFDNDVNLYNEHNEDSEIVSSQHFIGVNQSTTCCVNFKSKKCIAMCHITPLAQYTPRWLPPRSPHALIEEEFAENPWALLVATIFLNKTTGLKAKPLLWKFLQDYPDPISVAWADVCDLNVYFKNLGLVKRASMIQKMSREFLEGKWRKVGDLHGIGPYGEDAYRIFCLAEIDFIPCDRYLRLYVDWLNQRDHYSE